MKRTMWILAVCAGVAALGTTPPLVLRNVDVFDGEELRLHRNRTVVVRDGKIAAVQGPEDPIPAGEVLDGTGKGWTVMPGLVDLHTHIGIAGAPWFDPVTVSREDNLRTHLWSGVTTIAELHTQPADMDFLRRWNDPRLTPDVLMAGPLFTTSRGHGTQFPGAVAREVNRWQDLDEQWRRHMAEGPHLTKAVLENALWIRAEDVPVNEWPTLTERILAELASRSRREGLPLFVHVWTLEHAKMAVRAGATALAHGVYTSPVDDELVLNMARRGVGYVPTLSVALGARSAQQPAFADRFPLKDVLCPDLLRSVTSPANVKKAQQTDLMSEHKLGDTARFYGNLKRMYDAGVPLGIGTDTGNPFTFHGPSVHHEIDHFVAAGIPLAEVMRIATAGSADLLGRGTSLGRLRPGYTANLLVVEGDPLTDPAAHNRVRHVVHQGHPVDRDALARETTRPECKLTAPSSSAGHHGH